MIIVGLFNFGTGLRTVMVHNPQIDIVLAFDQSGSMAERDFSHIYDGFKEWVKWYYGANGTKIRFAIIGCADHNRNGMIQLMLKETNQDDVVKEIEAIKAKPHTEDYFDSCFDSIRKDIFNENNGDRNDAPNVVIRK